MNEIDADILKKITSEFKIEDLGEVISIFKNIFLKGSIVGTAQLTRSILYLSNGDLKKIKEYLKVDPRDVILAAERKAGNPGHYFNIPFPEIDNFFERMYDVGSDDDESNPQ